MRFVTDFPTPELVTRSNEYHDVILLPHLGASTKEAEVNCAVMAAEQISNFLNDGVIVNSVNFPSIKLGRKTKYRMVIINQNEPGMIGKITDEIGYKNINIADMTHKSRDAVGINLIDLEDEPSEELEEDNREERAIEFYRLLSSFDYMSSTPTLFNSGTKRPQLSSCYLTTIPDDLDGIFGAMKDNALELGSQ